jgi:predicted enzyme related to lactoylglutathione lyase
VGERAAYELGTFCWIDLATSDPAAATGFYTSLFGWQAEELSARDGDFTLLRRAGKEVAVIYRQNAAELAAKVTPHWTSYISVADAAKTAARARELGAMLYRETCDVANVGRVVKLLDPVGAIVSLWEPRPPGAHLAKDIDAWSWNELTTDDFERAKSFYGRLLGWEFQTNASSYATIVNAGRINGSIRLQSERERGTPARWIPFFAVASVEAASPAAEQLGGRVLTPLTVVGDEPVSIISDPQGAVFAVVPADPS